MAAVRRDALSDVVGYSERGMRMLSCPSCGPVIAVSRDAQDGDIGYCRVCGREHRLHRDGDSFAVEPTGAMGGADDLKPRPEIRSIEAFISRAPMWVTV